MARVTAGVAMSHVPAIGAAVDLGKTREPYWKPLFAGFEFSRQWIADENPDVIFLVYNDHATAFGLDNIPTFLDFREALEKTSCDAVLVSPVAEAHAAAALAAIQAGCHLLIEKPMVTVLADAFGIAQAARGKGVVVAVVPHLVAGRNRKGKPNRQIDCGQRVWQHCEGIALRRGLKIPGEAQAFGGLPIYGSWHGQDYPALQAAGLVGI